MTKSDEFVDIISAAVAADPTNLALREDLITLLLQHDLHRADREIAAFEAAGGEPATVRLLRARLLAARMRANTAPAPAAAAPTDAPATEAPLEQVPEPSDEDDSSFTASVTDGLWDAERPSVTLADVAGLADVKQHLDMTFLAPLRNPEIAAAFGQRPGGSLLMYGPPGCGKTFIAKAIAGDLGASFIHVTLADMLSKWLGDSEKAIQSLFAEAREAAPCVIFFDEFDALGGRRSSGGSGAHSLRMIVTQLLEELDGVDSDNHGIYFLAATNRPWDIDPALRRPGRIDKTVVVLPPDAVARAAILQTQLADKPTDNVDTTAVAAVTEGFSGADIAQVAREALQLSMTASMEAGTIMPVTTQHLLSVAQRITPSTRSWFDQVAPVLEYGVDDGTFDQVRTYRVRSGMR